ncbi:MAG TPA: radical SAM protein [Armatimonadota bacterium]|jgi:predicted DNA-binding helix-hairpin-helix protein
MDSETKLGLLTDEATYEVTGRGEGAARGKGSETAPPCGNPGAHLTQVQTPSGTVSLMKVMQTNVCCMDCGYCFTRAAKDRPRATFQPEELAKTFRELNRAGLAQGLFLSSAIPRNGVDAMDQELKTADILRNKLGFRGYIHLKVMPGSERAQVAEAVRLADRVSINLEAPTETYLEKLSKRKKLEDDILKRMAWVAEESRLAGLPSGHTTQFVLGAAGEADRDVLGRLDQLYSEFYLRRAHFSAFTPIEGTPLDGVPPTPSLREKRLYEADFLIRQYRTALADLPFDGLGNLPLSLDPKLAMALQRPGLFPVEVNRDSLEVLLQVPGVGPLSARRIVSYRRDRLIGDLRELQTMGVVTRRAAPFLLISGRAQGDLGAFLREQERRAQERPAVQLSLFA